MEKEHLKISDEGVRQIMIAEGLWKARKAKKAVVHQLRERRACVGELVQIDGSLHAWFERRAEACVLLVFIDRRQRKATTIAFCREREFFQLQ